MKSVLKIGNMRTLDDVNSIRNVLADNQGILACQVSREKQEVSVVYDDYFINIDKIIDSIEDLGYTVI